jgi:hypothetical protein
MTGDAVLALVGSLLESASIPYMVVGSIASSIHGEPRTTFDLDIVIDPTGSSLKRFLDVLPERFYVDADTARDALRRRSMFNLIDQDSGWKIDLIVRKDRPYSVEELARRQQKLIDSGQIYVASPEDTVVSKLEWAKLGESARQIDDVRKILALQSDLDREYIERWVAELDLAAQWAAAQR